MTEYVPVLFDAATLLSARIMNLLGTQYACAKSFTDIHIHDDIYYNKATAQAKYSVPNVALLDADKLDGKHYNELIGSLIPIGMSFGWNGTDVDVPSTFRIADGSTVNGIQLPDSRGNILMGAGSVHAARSSGGLASLSEAGGTVNIAGHILTLGEIPLHYHNWIDHYNNGGGQSGSYPGAGPLSSRATQTGYNHDVADEAHGTGAKDILLSSFSIVPLYFCKYLITKVS